MKYDFIIFSGGGDIIKSGGGGDVIKTWNTLRNYNLLLITMSFHIRNFLKIKQKKLLFVVFSIEIRFFNHFMNFENKVKNRHQKFRLQVSHIWMTIHSGFIMSILHFRHRPLINWGENNGFRVSLFSIWTYWLMPWMNNEVMVRPPESRV